MVKIDERTRRQIADHLLAANEVNKRVSSALFMLDPQMTRSVFYQRSRVKSFESIAGKIDNRRRERPNYKFGEMTDIVGLRLVCLYDQELADILDAAFQLLHVGRQGENPVFSSKKNWLAIDHINFYTRAKSGGQDPYVALYNGLCDDLREFLRDEHPDLNSTQVQEYVDRVLRKDPKGRSYSSLHIVAWARSTLGARPIEVPIEIQIRTAIEDVWGEIVHQQVYKTRHPYLWTDRLDGIYDKLDRQSDILKSNMDQLPAQISEIGFAFTEATKVLEQFKRPDVQYSFSVVISYIAIALNSASRGTYIGNDLQRALEAYEKAFAAIAVKGQLKTAILKLKAVHDLVDASDIDERTKELVACLLALEEIRLQAIGDKRASRRTLSNDKAAARALELCEKLARLEHDPKLSIKPMTVIKFWEYYILEDLYPSKAKVSLLEAYESLRDDDSLARWSIYRILIPRGMALFSWREALEIIDYAKSAEDLQRSVFFYKSFVADAIYYCKEALSVAEAPPNRRGDLIFGDSIAERAEDTANLLEIVNFSLTNKLYTEQDFHDIFELDLGKVIQAARDEVSKLPAKAPVAKDIRTILQSPSLTPPRRQVLDLYSREDDEE